MPSNPGKVKSARIRSKGFIRDRTNKGRLIVRPEELTADAVRCNCRLNELGGGCVVFEVQDFELHLNVKMQNASGNFQKAGTASKISPFLDVQKRVNGDCPYF
jgi:hypothetical protein